MRRIKTITNILHISTANVVLFHPATSNIGTLEFLSYLTFLSLLFCKIFCFSPLIFTSSCTSPSFPCSRLTDFLAHLSLYHAHTTGDFSFFLSTFHSRKTNESYEQIGALESLHTRDNANSTGALLSIKNNWSKSEELSDFLHFLFFRPIPHTLHTHSIRQKKASVTMSSDRI